MEPDKLNEMAEEWAGKYKEGDLSDPSAEFVKMDFEKMGPEINELVYPVGDDSYLMLYTVLRNTKDRKIRGRSGTRVLEIGWAYQSRQRLRH